MRIFRDRSLDRGAKVKAWDKWGAVQVNEEELFVFVHTADS